MRIEKNTGKYQKFLNILVRNIMVVDTLTRSVLLHFKWDLKAKQVTVQFSLIW